MKNSPKFIGLSDSRLFHMRGVAYKSYDLAREVFNMEEDMARSLFLMGLVHDFAYSFVENQADHEHEGGRILELSGFNWANSVFNHGDPDVDDWTDELLILNLADMTTSPDGKPITIDQRLEDIENRYGTNSIQATKARKLTKRIKEELSERNLTIPNL